MNQEKIDAVVARWTNPELRPLFKGQLIDKDGCCCAQGDILRHECQISDDELKEMSQSKADRLVAEELGISRFQAVLLRYVNDKDGCPQDALAHPENVLGEHAGQCLAFGRYLDGMTTAAWYAAKAARYAAGVAGYAAGVAADAAGAAAADAAGAVRDAAGAVRDAARAYRTVNRAPSMAAAGAAVGAMNEIQGQDVMRQKGQSFYFLPLFGFATPEDIPMH